MNPYLAAGRAADNPVQWSTLAWVIGAIVVAAVVIAIIVLVSRRPKSMEHGMEEFSRSLQAVAPNHRSVARTSAPARPRPTTPAAPPPEHTVRASRGEAGNV